MQGVPCKPNFPVQTLLTVFLKNCIKPFDVCSNYSVSEKLTFAIPHILSKKVALIMQTKYVKINIGHPRGNYPFC